MFMLLISEKSLPFIQKMNNNSKFIEIIMSKENNGMERAQLQKALERAAQMGGMDKVDLPLLYAMVGSMAATAPPPEPVATGVK